jgi:predicted nucleotidyltransferase
MDMENNWLECLRSWASANDSVRELWLFGSRAQCCSRPSSDVDLALALMPPKGNTDWAFGNFVPLASAWKKQLEEIVGRDVDLEAIRPGVPGPDYDAMVRCFGVRLWSRVEAKSNSKPLLALKQALTGPSIEDYDVFADGAVVGRFSKSATGPADRLWMWTITGAGVPPSHGFAATPHEAQAAFAATWRAAADGH